MTLAGRNTAARRNEGGFSPTVKIPRLPAWQPKSDILAGFACPSIGGAGGFGLRKPFNMSYLMSLSRTPIPMSFSAY